ncbi:MAG: thioredoxin family protein [Ignavibacteriales bacterium]
MKSTIIILFMLTVLSFAQGKYRIVNDEKKNLPMLVGICERSNFSDSTFAKWWNEEYEYYVVDTLTLGKIKNYLNEIKILIVMGTWCSDSRREVPHLFKIFDYLNYSKDNYEIIAVDRKKNALTDISNLKIELVPTIIVYKNNNEIGRIVEAPQETLELDLVKMIKN